MVNLTDFTTAFPADAHAHYYPWLVEQSHAIVNAYSAKTLTLSAIAGFVLLVYVVKSISFSMKGHLPPGPRGLPLVGNLFQLSLDLWVPCMEWKQKFGDLVYINVAGQGMLVMNSHKVVGDLMDRKASNYSNRPRWIVASEILSGGYMMVFQQYTDTWRRMRRAGHEGLNKAVVHRFHAPQQREAVILTYNMLKDSSTWREEIGRATASMIFSVVYDKPPIASNKDPQVQAVNDMITRIVRAALPGAYLVEFFTWMKYLPNWMAKWKRDAEESFRKDSETFEGLFQEAKKKVLSGEDRPSMAATLVKDKEKHNLNDSECAWLAGTMYAAGAETTAGVMAWFMLAMLRYPQVQRKVQEELDTVVGRHRMPTFADFNHLPYVRATVREALRWHPVDPVGLPHQSIDDDYYNGYFIPKNTICIANVWALNRDPVAYGADAEHFNPGRFIDEKGQLKPAIDETHDEGHITYGFGRRICVGRFVSNNSLFIDIACLLWACDIRPVKDENGRDMIPPEDNVNDGLVVRPVNFKCSITPRFPEAAQIVAQTKELHEG